MEKKFVCLLLLIMLAFPTMIAKENKEKRAEYTHTVFAEVATSQACGYCHFWNEHMHDAYESGNYDFEYVEMIVYDHYWGVLNWDAYDTMVNYYGVTAYPTTEFDGGYQEIVGNYPELLPDALNASGTREVADIEANITVYWLGNATLAINITIKNNEETDYSGFIRTCITEIISRYDTAYGAPYYFGFLDYAFDQPQISIPAGGTYTNSTIWNGNEHADAHGDDFGDITPDNIWVILAVFNNENGYVDETVATMPILPDTTPPEILDINAHPWSQETNGYVNITAIVTDNKGVNIVKVNITTPDGTYINETMNNIGNLYYYNATYHTIGNYSFYIWARDINGNSNKSSIYSFSIHGIQCLLNLKAGWNLITIACQNNYTAKSLGENITGCSIVSRWNASLQQFQSYLVGISPDSFNFEIEDGVGYFVYVNNDTTFEITSYPIYSVAIQLYQGWNIIGWFSDSTTASSLGENITGCSIVSKWNASLQQFQSYLVGISPPEFDFIIKQGMGIFIYTNEASIWHGEG